MAGAPVRVKAVATVRPDFIGGPWPLNRFTADLLDCRWPLNFFRDLIGRSVCIELVSSDLDQETGQQRQTVRSYARKVKVAGPPAAAVTYEAHFDVPANFGPVGAVVVTNERSTEVLLEDVRVDVVTAGKSFAPITIRCHSWVQPRSGDGTAGKRVFFVNAYLPSQTPSGLRSYRRNDLQEKRGDGTGKREATDRIYDYDVYNDLGDPDAGSELGRSVLGGGKKFPYPRRCRTGRPRSTKEAESETRSGGAIYVPRDEEFSKEKNAHFSTKTRQSALHAALTAIESTVIDPHEHFPSFFFIDKMFEDGVVLPRRDQVGILRSTLNRAFHVFREGIAHEIFLFDTPANACKDKFAWLTDNEFARETLAGINPYAIELLKEFPPKSKLNPAVYGPAESAIAGPEARGILEMQMRNVMNVDEAVRDKRLFMLDYHDLFLPYVHKIREQDNTTMYCSRTFFFLGADGTLRLLAIELTRPATPDSPQWSEIFTPSTDTTKSWLWKMAKSHVRAHDAGHHQLVTHWLRTHCAVEPYIIAANRQLSEMHPIYHLLRPHFRYTMRINALARSALVNAGGTIETAFAPLKYSMELSSVAYDKLWRFDMEALPADLIRRGMAEEDPEAEHGLRLAIKDYPFANDGLLIWDAIKGWVKAYVSRYYPEASTVAGDTELQAFWEEVRTKGHGDKKNEPWWPKLDTPENLVQTLTIIIWVAAAHHAAVNFGQYDFAGYFPNRPSVARTNMPTEEPRDPKAFHEFLSDPDEALRKCFPSQMQATLVMAVLHVLSSNSPDEEYLGGTETAPWTDDAAVQAAYGRFSQELKDIEEVINDRNTDVNLKNRCGAGMVPYQLMKPGLLGKKDGGMPNSTSI